MNIINVSFSSDALDNLIKDYYEYENVDKPILNITLDEILEVADKIFINETGGNKEYLVTWNKGENFPSLGIGHFIWEKSKGSNGIYGDSFRGLLEYYKKNDIELPKILLKNNYSPWKSRKDLITKRNKGNKDIKELIDFFDVTRGIQVLYIYERLENSLDKMIKVSKNKENLKYQFYRVANSKNGLYALIDYVNFKGEGIATSRAYNYQGWGLRQVLENMKGTELGDEAILEFTESAKKVLRNRVKNAPKNEKKWIAGWFKRIDTYKE